jgi:hypothetical protein
VLADPLGRAKAFNRDDREETPLKTRKNALTMGNPCDQSKLTTRASMVTMDTEDEL